MSEFQIKTIVKKDYFAWQTKNIHIFFFSFFSFYTEQKIYKTKKDKCNIPAIKNLFSEVLHINLVGSKKSDEMYYDYLRETYEKPTSTTRNLRETYEKPTRNLRETYEKPTRNLRETYEKPTRNLRVPQETYEKPTSTHNYFLLFKPIFMYISGY